VACPQFRRRTHEHPGRHRHQAHLRREAAERFRSLVLPARGQRSGNGVGQRRQFRPALCRRRGINSGFARALSKLKIDAYAARHQALLAKARGGGPDIETYADPDPMAFSLVFPTALPSKKGSDEEGVCFVDVFAPEHCPNGVSANAAMLYVAPPNRLFSSVTWAGHRRAADRG
jgi:hypothetical protein